jgi:hypothetical protein
MRLVFVMLLGPAAARAEPMSLAFHGGVATSRDTLYGSDGSGTQSGWGWVIDADAGWRVSPRVSIHAFAAYATMRETGSWNDLGEYDAIVRDRYLDTGARLRFHLAHAFAGLGLGVEAVHETGSYSCGSRCNLGIGPPGPSYPIRTTRFGPLFELHAGYTFAEVRGIAPQLTWTAQYVDPRDDAITGGVISTRLAVGVVF